MGGLKPAVMRFAAIALLTLLSGCALERFGGFSVESVSVEENGIIGTGYAALEVVFSTEIDELSVSDAVRIETDSGEEISITREVSGRNLHLAPEEPWSPHERFWLVILKELKDVYGKELEHSFYRAFQSTGELLPASAVLVSPSIQNGVLKQIAGFFEIAFNRDVDRGSVERAFSISPSVEGSFEWTSNRTFVFRPAEELQKNSFYSLQISEDALDSEGIALRLFVKEFEYFPNEDYPLLSSIKAAGNDIFSASAPASFRLEDGTYVIEHPDAEKDLSYRFYFTKPIDKATFGESLEVSPFASWEETWIDEDMVEISFTENLRIDGRYALLLGPGVKDTNGLPLQYEYKIYIHVNAAESSFLEFYAVDFAALEASAFLSGPSGPIPVSLISKGSNDDGLYIDIQYTDPVPVEDVDVDLLLKLSFSNLYYTPVVERASLQDSVSFIHILGLSPLTRHLTGSIHAFDWISGHECIVRLKHLGAENIYGFKIDGGKDGVLDDRDNYMQNSIEYYFKLRLTKS